MNYGHHETCGICHTSGPCKHTMDRLSADIKANWEKPREVAVKVLLPRTILDISNNVIPDTITWYRQLDEITQEIIDGYADEIRKKVIGELQKLCQHADRRVETRTHNSDGITAIYECVKCKRIYQMGSR